MNIGIIIFARMSSSRLPGKMLMNISGRTLLETVIERAKRIDGASNIVVATSEQQGDNQICKQAENSDVLCFRGSLEDVTARALGCAEKYGFDYIVRICGDRPFLEPELYTNLIQLCKAKDMDLATNVIGKTFSPGLTAEVVKTSSLKKYYPYFDISDKEHVTQYFYKNQKIFSIKNITSLKPEYKNISLVIDTKKDLEKIQWVSEQLGENNINASIDDIFKYTKQWTEKYEIN